MFIFLLQVRNMLAGYPELYLFAVYSVLIWGLWIVKVVMSRRYRPYTEPHKAGTSIIIPVVDEPLDLFRDVLQRIVDQKPDEIIVVINGKRNFDLEEVCAEFAPAVQWVHTPIAGKRNAVKIGVERSKYEISVLVDSDTIWTPGCLEELIKPFKDARVGGVTTRQRILEPERRWMTRWADWLENSRALYSMPAQSVVGQVGCLPGRTIAFRRDILVRVMPQFMSEKFLGVFLEVSDDRTLTNLTLKDGYRTVYQYTSLCYTDAPTKLPKLYKQQLRWARGSQYNTLRMLPWMLSHAPLLALFMVMDIVLPFLLAGVIAGWIYRSVIGEGYNFYEPIVGDMGIHMGIAWIIGLVVVSSVLSMAIRQLRHLSEKPSDFFRLPIFILASTAFLMPIRLIGFFRMAHVAGWGTRAGAYKKGDPITETDVTPDAESERMHDDLDELLRNTTRMAPETPPRGIPVISETDAAADVPVSTGAVGTVTRRAQARIVSERLAATPRPDPQPRATPEPARKRLNPQAAWPYVIGFAIIALEGAFIVFGTA
ncbi:glycosyltransferase family 2 protein [Microbacterium sp. NPDC057407]|uniref:glycosyltransferase family 2 protein n=1 Tax=Microbacterium sp. NPDC057407 TaxID=3346120 RepID=UPI00366BAA87